MAKEIYNQIKFNNKFPNQENVNNYQGLPYYHSPYSPQAAAQSDYTCRKFTNIYGEFKLEFATEETAKHVYNKLVSLGTSEITFKCENNNIAIGNSFFNKYTGAKGKGVYLGHNGYLVIEFSSESQMDYFSQVLNIFPCTKLGDNKITFWQKYCDTWCIESADNIKDDIKINQFIDAPKYKAPFIDVRNGLLEADANFRLFLMDEAEKDKLEALNNNPQKLPVEQKDNIMRKVDYPKPVYQDTEEEVHVNKINNQNKSQIKIINNGKGDVKIKFNSKEQKEKILNKFPCSYYNHEIFKSTENDSEATIRQSKNKDDFGIYASPYYSTDPKIALKLANQDEAEKFCKELNISVDKLKVERFCGSHANVIFFTPKGYLHGWHGTGEMVCQVGEVGISQHDDYS